MGASKSNSKKSDKKDNSKPSKNHAVDDKHKSKGIVPNSKNDKEQNIKCKEVCKPRIAGLYTEGNEKHKEGVKYSNTQDSGSEDETELIEPGSEDKLHSNEKKVQGNAKLKDHDQEPENKDHLSNNDLVSKDDSKLKDNHAIDDDSLNEQDKNCGILRRNSEKIKSDTTHDKLTDVSKDNAKETKSERHVRWNTKVYVKSEDGTVSEEEPLTCDVCCAVIKRYHEFPRTLNDYHQKQSVTPEKQEESSVEQASDNINELDIRDSIELNKKLLKEEDKTKSYSVETAEESPRDLYICDSCHLEMERNYLKEK